MRKRKRIFNMQTTNWVDYTPLREMQCSYIMAIGERSSGKTYGVKEIAIDKFKKDRGQFLYLRRRHAYITQRKMIRLFDDIGQYAIDELGSDIYYSANKGFIVNIDGKEEVFGYATSLDDIMAEKGVSFEKITTVLFDEFVDLDYFDNEIERFLNIISTITRNRDNIEIFMCGNTISKNCPYFEMFGIDPNRIERGKTYRFIHDMGVSLALYYTKSKVVEIGSKTKNHKYLGFDNNESVKMILYGDWESKKVETKSIDGFGWSSERILIPCYITAIKQTYELSLLNYNKSKIPVLFVRKPNTQEGRVSTKIRYNVSSDMSISLVNKNGIVPTMSRICSFIDDETRKMLDIAFTCISCGRVVFSDNLIGTEFLQIIENVK